MLHRSLAFRTAPFFGTIALATALLASSCGSDPPPAGPGPIPIESFRTEYESASCEYAVRCGLMPDTATCLRVSPADFETLQLIADATLGSIVTYDQNAARTCVTAIRSRSCNTLISVQRQVEDACKAVFTGTIPEGGDCIVSDECAGDSVCDRTACEGMGRCCEGVCAPATPKVAIGGDCSMAPCVDEAYCDQSGAGGGGGTGGGAPVSASCVARLDNGESCEDSGSCKDGLRCDTSGSSKCYILSPSGGQCNATLAVACLASNQYCDATESKCVTLPGAGSPCTPDGGCLPYAFCDNGTCRTRPLENEACAQDGPSCLGDMYCDTDVCTLGDTQVCPSPNP